MGNKIEDIRKELEEIQKEIYNSSQKKFYEGELVKPVDLNTLQDYTDKAVELMVRDVVGSGVIQGFEVTKYSERVLRIGPGLAYDDEGHRLVLEEELFIDITKYLAENGLKDYNVHIKKRMIESDPDYDINSDVVYKTLTPSIEVVIVPID